ncbi:MAG TPA: PQQ-binding-like beta-propeller repeat protein [Pyrinomonadaceae bacterium]|nr:PQQ-binding-like beta-propeller repeat protein [Pyrinomonadaceae bacterium]
MPQIARPSMRYVLPLLILLVAAAPLFEARAQRGARPEARQVGPPIRIAWKEQPGVRRYRLQIARDPQFADIIFDRLVYGHEYTVNELPNGRYYWRIAPAPSETGQYSQATPVQVGGGTGAQTDSSGTRQPDDSRAVVASDTTGWRTATGNIAQPLAAPLRTGASPDFVGVNEEGMVYALDGTNGVALWTARFRPRARRGEPTGNGGARPVTPVIVPTDRGNSNVVVAFEGGVRALEGGTGRELWKQSVTGRAASGAAADLDGDGKAEVYVVSDGTPTLTVLASDTGRVIAQSRLDANVVGAPSIFRTQGVRGVVMAFDGGLIEVRSGNAERALSIKLDAQMTTPPLFVQAAGGAVVLIGTEKGLIALNANDLKPLWRVATDEDAPRGTLASTDLDGDGMPDAVMVTRRGRTVAVNTVNGKIMWYSTGANDAASATFADLDGDGAQDVIVAAGPAFAAGFSGRSGEMIWKAEDESRRTSTGTGSQAESVRGLVTVPVSSGATGYLIGSDAARTGLRAVSLPRGTSRASNSR